MTTTPTDREAVAAEILSLKAHEQRLLERAASIRSEAAELEFRARAMTAEGRAAHARAFALSQKILQQDPTP